MKIKKTNQNQKISKTSSCQSEEEPISAHEEALYLSYVGQCFIVQNGANTLSDRVGVVNSYFAGYFEVIWEDNTHSFYNHRDFSYHFCRGELLIGYPTSQFDMK